MKTKKRKIEKELISKKCFYCNESIQHNEPSYEHEQDWRTHNYIFHIGCLFSVIAEDIISEKFKDEN